MKTWIKYEAEKTKHRLPCYPQTKKTYIRNKIIRWLLHNHWLSHTGVAQNWNVCEISLFLKSWRLKIITGLTRYCNIRITMIAIYVPEGVTTTNIK